VQVGVRPSQPHRPRVMQGLAARRNVNRSQGRSRLGIELRERREGRQEVGGARPLLATHTDPLVMRG
jgi:hypothetical protein